jgi:hypothetical protein
MKMNRYSAKLVNVICALKNHFYWERLKHALIIDVTLAYEHRFNLSSIYEWYVIEQTQNKVLFPI